MNAGLQTPEHSQAPELETSTELAYPKMVRCLSSHAALWVGAGWGFAEAMLFFIVPDVWLGLVALYAPRRMLVTLAAIVAGAIAGAAIFYLATLALGESLSGVITMLPGITAYDLDTARLELADQGAVAFLSGILQALPVKVYIHASALDGIGLPDVLVFTVLNRIERLLVFGLVMALVGWLGRRFISRWPRCATALYVLAWFIFYAVFLLGKGV